MGGSQSRQELETARADLAAAKATAKTLAEERDGLKERIAAQQAELEQSQGALADAKAAAEAAIAKKTEEVSTAVKKQELAEELRRSDALLAKRLLDAQLRLYGGKKNLPPLGGMPEEMTLAANLALAAQDELQLRQMLLHTANELEATQKLGAAMGKSALYQKRGELARELWLPDLCDVSLTVRSKSLLMLAGARMPRKPRPGMRGGGLSPALAVLGHFGDDLSAPDGKWAAIGGSLLFDTREREVSALRLALLAQPMDGHQYGMSMDHTGSLTASLKLKPSPGDAVALGLSARIFGTVDLQRRKANRAGVELVYDVPDDAP